MSASYILLLLDWQQLLQAGCNRCSLACLSCLQYPFGGLPHFPEAYPILLSGNAQSDTQAGNIVTVLASSTEVFNSLPSALPTFADWVNYSAGVNINKTFEVRMRAFLLECAWQRYLGEGGAAPGLSTHSSPRG